MGGIIAWLVGVLAFVALALAGLAWRFTSRIAGAERRLLAERPVAAAPKMLPCGVEQAAARAGVPAARPPRGVRIRQAAELRMAPHAAWQRIEGRQVIATGVAGFSWVATRRVAGVPLTRIWDAYIGGSGQLRVALLGGIEVVTATGDDLDLGEAMRYLAELAWCPDALLHNPAVEWQEAGDGWLSARLNLPQGNAELRLRASVEGDVIEMRASGRPARLPDGTTELREWRGYFSDHSAMGGRRIPLRGEVGYVLEGQYAPYWRGEITGFELLD